MRYAIDGKYPIETKEQLTKTAAYFDKYLDRFHPMDRVTVASALEKRANELGICLDNGWIKNYSRALNDNAILSPDFDKNIEMRKYACSGKVIKNIKAEEFLEKIAEISKISKPKNVVDALFEFDKLANLEYQWDKSIVDPVMTVFGSLNNPEYDAVKLAGEITDYKVKKIAANENEIVKLASVLGKQFQSDFIKSPVETIKKLNEIEKLAFCNTVNG